jgi:hypothetical protein
VESQSGCPDGRAGRKNQGFVPDGKYPAMLVQGCRQQLMQQYLQLHQDFGPGDEVGVFTAKQFVNLQGIVHKLI